MTWRARTVPAATGLLVVAAGLALEATATGPAADKAGDVLYAVLVVQLAWLLVPAAPVRALAGAALAWCVAVELLQATGLPGRVTSVVPAARLVLGSGFDAWDLPAYAVGAVVGAVVVLLLRRAPGPRAA